jgi:hypothetical protein
MCSRLDEAEHLLSRYDREKIRERRPRNRREEKMSAGLVDPKKKKKKELNVDEMMRARACRAHLDQLRT